MKKIVVYCHGYASSAATDKVQDLRKAGFEVFAWDFDFAEPFEDEFDMIGHKVDRMLIDHLNQDIELIFVGTSMGCIVAKNLADLFGAVGVYVNPCFNPSVVLKDLEQEELAVAYKDISVAFDDRDVIFIGLKDELIDFSELPFNGSKIYYSENADHRFGMPHFQEVIDYVAKM